MGKIHSLQTMGLVDGPGIRSVVFFQGCKLRCAYCHNPDTWDPNRGQEITAEELVQRLIRFRPYYQKSGGGVTCSGGEPLLQPEFLLELLRLCRENGIHTALDTSGVGLGDYEDILAATDLVILDLKHSEPAGFQALTGGDMAKLQEFIEALNKTAVPVWIRHVVVPGFTDNELHLKRLKKIIATIKNVEKVELLPYHQMGVYKYRELGYPNRLQDVPPLSEEKFREIEKKFYQDKGK
mgnify:CR=1 FL=1